MAGSHPARMHLVQTSSGKRRTGISPSGSIAAKTPLERDCARRMLFGSNRRRLGGRDGVCVCASPLSGSTTVRVLAPAYRWGLLFFLFFPVLPQLRVIRRNPACIVFGEQLGTMSALPPKADIAECDRHVRFVPKADIPSPTAARRK